MAEEKNKKKKTPAVITDEIAVIKKDIDIFWGYAKWLENPDPVLRTEARGKGLKLYDEVDRDAHAGAVLQSRYLAVVSKEWEIIPAEEPKSKGRPAIETRSQKIADFVKKALDDTNFDQGCMELLQGILYGYYTAEVIWKTTADAVLPHRILAKHPRRFVFTPERDLRLLTPQNMIEGEPVPDRKFIVFTYGYSDNPYGRGLGQTLWWPVWFKKHGIKFWLVFLEKFGMPTPVGKYPPGTEPKQQQALLDAIDAWQRETGIKIPNTMEIEILEATRRGSADYNGMCDYMDKQISKRVLGQTATTEGTPGKLGNEESQDETRQDVVKSDADLLCECLNGTLIRWIVDYNFPGVTDYPKIWRRTEKEQDLKELAERDKILVNDIRLPVSRDYFYETYGIPKPGDDEDLVNPSSAPLAIQPPGMEPPSFTGKGKTKTYSMNAIDAKKFKEFAETLKNAADLALEGMSGVPDDQWEDVMGPLIAPVMRMISEAGDFSEVEKKLTKTYKAMDPEALRELIARARFLAGTWGRIQAKEETSGKA